MRSLQTLLSMMLVSGLFLFTGCSSPPDPESYIKILRIGTTDTVQSANILLDSYLSVWARISNPSFMRMNSAGRVEGQLLQLSSVSDDLARWNFSLLDDFSWSDGIPITPDDIKFTLEYLRDHYPPAAWIKTFISDISVTTDNDVSILLSRPYARLDFDFTSYPVLPRHIWSKVANPRQYTNPGPNIGCGPFFISEIDLTRNVITFSRNHYWLGPQPQLDKIEIHIYKNKDTLSLALEKGLVDTCHSYASSYPYTNLARLKASRRFSYLESLNQGLHFLGWNIQRPPMSDLRFREALISAIDYSEIIKLITLGYGQVPNRGFIPPSMRFFKPTAKLSYQPQKADRLFIQAGYTDSDGDGIREDRQGREIKLSLLANPSDTAELRLAELIREYLEKVGLNLELKSADGASWVSLKDKYHYDLIISRSSPWGMNMYASWATGYFDTRRTGEGVLHYVSDPVYHQLCDAILSATDEQRLESLAHQVQDYYAEFLPAVALYWNTLVIPYNNKFSGWNYDPLYGFFNIPSFIELREFTQ